MAVLENKLGKTDEWLLSREEERLSKIRALELFDRGLIDRFEVGTFKGLSDIHAYLFSDIYDFAGKIRSVDMAKGHFRFASYLYLDAALKRIEKMPQKTFDDIIDKYVEMNVVHPFREGNGRGMRLWLDAILKKELRKVINWAQVVREDYLLAMERSPVRSTEIKTLLHAALTDRINDRVLFMKGVDASYHYEGYQSYLMTDLDKRSIEDDGMER